MRVSERIKLVRKKAGNMSLGKGGLQCNVHQCSIR